MRIAGISLLIVLSTCGNSPHPARNVEALWKGVDVQSLPLQVQNLEEVREEGIVIRKLLYVSQLDGDFPARIIAYYGFPASQASAAPKGLPAVLHIHGGGQTANREYVRYFARKGYAALSIDWGGNPLPGGGGNSIWGKLAVEQSDNAQVFRMPPNLRQNPWFYWTVACRRAITFLEQQPEVDASRIGIFGVSMGGRLTWLVAGTDPRVKAAVSIYGSVDMTVEIPGVAGSEQQPFSREDAALWSSTLDAAAYASRIRCPFLYLSAADDYYGSMDFADRELNRIVQAPHWQSFTPHFNHHVEPQQSASLVLWMDRWLKGGPAWPQTPKLLLDDALDEGVPQLKLEPDKAGEVAGVSIYYSTGIWPASRFWRQAHVARQGNAWIAHSPLTETGSGLFAYANVNYRSGISISSRLLTADAANLRSRGAQITDLPTTLIDDFARGGADWFVPEVSVDPLLQEKSWFRATDGPDGRPAITFPETQGTGWRLATRKVGDPKWRGPQGVHLRFAIYSEQANTVVAVATEDERRRPYRSRTFVATAPLHGGRWETVNLPVERFRSRIDGAPLASWDRVNLLAIQGRFVPRGRDRSANSSVSPAWNGPSPSISKVQWSE